ncbi:MAG: hypothetical protein AAFX08_06085 [Pseudomonadota bacterium]
MLGFIIDQPAIAAAYLIVVVAATAGASFLIARRLADSDFLLDAPSARSNHVRPTPRTGGVAIFVAFLGACFAMSMLTPAVRAPDGFAAFASVAIPAFLLGLADDWRSMPASRRLVYQVAVAIVFILTFGALTSAPVPVFGDTPLGWLGPVLTCFWIVAFMNAYNFMDGANGLAGLTGLAGACALAIAAGFGGDSVTSLIALALAAAILGFLPVNYPSGRIFLGDGGSMSVGFILAALSVLAARPDGAGVTPLFAPIVFMPLLFDVAMTLLSRIFRRRNIGQAHSEHVYQLLIRLGAPHARVAALYFALVTMTGASALAALNFSAGGQWAVVIVLALALAPAHLLTQMRGLKVGLLVQPVSRPARRRKRRVRRRAYVVSDDRPNADAQARSPIGNGAEADADAATASDARPVQKENPASTSEPVPPLRAARKDGGGDLFDLPARADGASHAAE